jgi:hypothetical protein
MGSVGCRSSLPPATQVFTCGHLQATGSIESVRMLLDAEASVSLTDKRAFTALSHAASGGHTEIVALLLQQPGVNPDQLQVTSQGNPLILAARSGRMDVLTLLMDASGDVNIKVQPNSNSLPRRTPVFFRWRRSVHPLSGLNLAHGGRLPHCTRCVSTGFTRGGNPAVGGCSRRPRRYRCSTRGPRCVCHVCSDQTAVECHGDLRGMRSRARVGYSCSFGANVGNRRPDVVPSVAKAPMRP